MCEAYTLNRRSESPLDCFLNDFSGTHPARLNLPDGVAEDSVCGNGKA
jgi:hypothetical protein